MGRPALPHRRLSDGTLTPEYRAWQSMRQRCGNPKLENFKHYGGRGKR